MKKNVRQKVTKLLIDTDLYKLEGTLDNFIEVLMKAREEAKRENFNVVTVDFGIGCTDEYGCCDPPYIEVEGSRLETIKEMKLREAAWEARLIRESKEHESMIIEQYKNHD